MSLSGVECCEILAIQREKKNDLKCRQTKKWLTEASRESLCEKSDFLVTKFADF